MSKARALKERMTDNKLRKVQHSAEYCRHCGKKTSTSTRHESGHREYDHEHNTADVKIIR